VYSIELKKKCKTRKKGPAKERKTQCAIEQELRRQECPNQNYRYEYNQNELYFNIVIVTATNQRHWQHNENVTSLLTRKKPQNEYIHSRLTQTTNNQKNIDVNAMRCIDIDDYY